MKIKLFFIVALLFFGCSTGGSNAEISETGHCYFYSAVYLSNPSDPYSLASQIKPYFPNSLGYLKPVFCHIYGPFGYSLEEVSDPSVAEKWVKEQPLIAHIRINTDTWHFLVITNIIGNKINALDTGGKYTELAFTISQNNGIWIENGIYCGSQILNFKRLFVK